MGVAFILLSLVVAVAAVNTGNNALFLVLALMLGVLSLSGFVSRWNLRGLRISLAAPSEVFANRPCLMDFELLNESRWWPHWFLLVDAGRPERARLISRLPKQARSRGQLELLRPQRGPFTLRRVQVASPFPFGLFRKAQAYAVDLEVLVYPELFDADEAELGGRGRLGDQGEPRPGQGHELRQLRAFRPGDDPRNIHWKRTAKTGSLIVMDKEERRGRRLSIVLDNGVGRLQGEARERFERLISEAATAAVELLDRGFEVELLSRDDHLPFAGGPRQRLAVLEVLALTEPCGRQREPLEPSDSQGPVLRFFLDASAPEAES
jgi:uncharacterized protein (DUF58 family)